MENKDKIKNLQEKYNSILENERVLTAHVAGEVIDKPLLSLWMILIPVFFVFYYFQFKRYKNGLTNFKHDFLRTRKRVLDAVHKALADKSHINLEELIAASNAPQHARDAYGAWVNELIVFYRSLMEANGSDYTSLVQSCYGKKSNYLLALNRLNSVERELNRALLPDLENEDERTTAAVESIEKSTAEFRRNQASDVFSR
ncbi:MAG: NF038143 family protein [Desulfocapsaceae bacterium]|nr:NF038143 family protein [Desulfocapsaceae bacterium]